MSAGSARLARWLVRRASAIVPQALRADWRREWDAELFHRAQDLEARGLLTARARTRLTLAACGALIHAIWLRKQDWSPSMLLQELRLAARALARRPGFTTAAVLTLALGIGANTAIFSVVYGVLLRPLPFRDPDRLVQLWETNPLRGWTEANVAPANLIDWKARNRVFEDIGYYFGSDTREGGSSVYTLEEGEPRQVRGLQVSVNLFDLLGVSPLHGRGFTPGMGTAGNHRVVLLSHGLWRQSFGGDPDIAGRRIQMGGAQYEVAGVMPAWFRLGSAPVDLWAPLVEGPQWPALRRPHFLRAIARLKPGVTIDQARGEMTRIMTELEREYPDTNTQMGAGLGPLDDWFVGEARRPLLVVFGAVGFVLLIACANVGSLVLARAASRAQEIAIRATLGASRFRIARQLMAETLVIAAAGSVLGFGLSWAALKGLLLLAPKTLPRIADVGLDLPVLLFTAIVGCATAVLFGLVPALWTSRLAAGHGVRTTSGHAAMRRALIVAEVALAVVLLAGAGLMLRSFAGLQRVDPGFDAPGVLTGQITLPSLRYDTAAKQQQFFEQVLDRLRALPGVTAAGAARLLPLSGYDWTSDLFVEGRDERSRLRELRHMTVTPGYFETLGIPLVAGRTYSRADDERAMPVIVINDTLARRAFPGENPIGRRITSSRGPQAVWRTIIGVVGDEKQDALNEPTEPEIYWSHLQSADSRMSIVVRTPGDPLSLVPRFRDAVQAVDPRVALADVAPMDARIAASLARERFSTLLIAVFGAAALLLAAVGIYGLAAFLVTSRTRELGVRLALGASRADVFALVLRQNLALAGLGLAAGLALAIALSRAVESLLYGVGPRDPLALGAAALLLVATAVAASVIPARRAVRIDPATALRAE